MASTRVGSEPPLVVIVGPTASGKTALAIEVATRYKGEIICADSRTIYRGMDVGTAKPSNAERRLVPHWGLDLVNPGERFTAADFQEYAKAKIIEIRARGKVPIIVGGTGLYVDAVIYDFRFREGYDESLRTMLNQLSLKELVIYCTKNNVDISSVDLNRRRIIRLIENKDKVSISKKIAQKNVMIVGIATNKPALQTRIAHRAEQIFADGVVDEAKSLGKLYGWGSEAMTGNIYPIVRDYLLGNLSYEEAVEKSAIRDRQLAKRQMTWFRRNPDVLWGTRDDLALAFEHIL